MSHNLARDHGAIAVCQPYAFQLCAPTVAPLKAHSESVITMRFSFGIAEMLSKMLSSSNSAA